MGVYGVAAHPDGSLICTTDLGGVCRVWDLRSGRTVLPLQGHFDQVLGCAFNRHGYMIATASDDHTVEILLFHLVQSLIVDVLVPAVWFSISHAVEKLCSAEV